MTQKIKNIQLETYRIHNTKLIAGSHGIIRGRVNPTGMSSSLCQNRLSLMSLCQSAGLLRQRRRHWGGVVVSSGEPPVRYRVSHVRQCAVSNRSQRCWRLVTHVIVGSRLSAQTVTSLDQNDPK